MLHEQLLFKQSSDYSVPKPDPLDCVPTIIMYHDTILLECAIAKINLSVLIMTINMLCLVKEAV